MYRGRIVKRALLVGTNPPGLTGCGNDANALSAFLQRRCRFNHDDICVLTDGDAIYNSICDKLGELVSGLQPSDTIVFSFSGHSVSLDYDDFQGARRTMGVLCPLDFDGWLRTAITSTQLRRLFATVPNGVRLAWIADCCHAGALQQDPLQLALGLGLRRNTAFAQLAGDPIGEAHPPEFGGAFLAATANDRVAKEIIVGTDSHGAFTYYLLQSLATRLDQPLTSVMDATNAAMVQGGYPDQHPELKGDASNRPFLQ